MIYRPVYLYLLVLVLIVLNGTSLMTVRRSLRSLSQVTRPRALKPASDANANEIEAPQIPINYNELTDDDPLFLDMPWPTQSGPESAAFARHMQWKRKLSDGERLRWQRWAVYKRSGDSGRFDYSLQDYVAQDMLAELERNAAKTKASGDLLNATIFSSVVAGMNAADETEIRAVMLAYYAAFNRKNIDEIRALWLPDDQCELVMPGYEKAVGDRVVDALYQKIVAESKPMGSIKANMSQIHCYGNIALVHTVEEVGEGRELQAASRLRKGRGASQQPSSQTMKPLPVKRVLASTVLRRANKQWRIVAHHAARLWTSPFTGDAIECVVSRADAKKRAEVMQQLAAAESARTASGRSGVGSSGVPGLVMQQVEQLVRESGGKLSEITRSGQQLRPELRLRADGTLERVITLSNTQAPVDDKGNTEGDAFVRPLSPAAVDAASKQTVHPRIKRKARPSDPGVNPKLSISKQAVQAIRQLEQLHRISEEDKDLLVGDLVRCIALGRTSRVETAFEMLYAMPMYELEGSSAENDPEQANACLSDFCAQCVHVLRDFRSDGTHNR